MLKWLFGSSEPAQPPAGAQSYTFDNEGRPFQLYMRGEYLVTREGRYVQEDGHQVYGSPTHLAWQVQKGLLKPSNWL